MCVLRMTTARFSIVSWYCRVSVCVSSGGRIVLYVTVRGVGEKLLQYPSVCTGDSTEGAPFENISAPTSCAVYTKGSLERTAATQYM
jgi:hypothetical protein